MASLLSTTAALSCASTNTIPKLAVAKSLSNSRCSSLIGSFIVLDAESAVLAHRLMKLKTYGLATIHSFRRNKPLVVCLSRVVARAYVKNDSGNSRNAEHNDNDDGDGGEQSIPDAYDLPPDSESQDDSVEIEIEKTGKNSRTIRSKIAVQASLLTVWDILTDYERLADFIPGLAVSQLVEKGDKFARLFQIGEQNLAFGLKFNAKGTIDCFEKDLQTLPFGKKRDIEFKMVEGDFQIFKGVWSIEQESSQLSSSQGSKWDDGDLQNDSDVGKEFQTTLIYIVHVKPKMWLPVQLVEGRLCNEIKKNLSSIRDEAEKAFQNTESGIIVD